MLAALTPLAPVLAASYPDTCHLARFSGHSFVQTHLVWDQTVPESAPHCHVPTSVVYPAILAADLQFNERGADAPRRWATTQTAPLRNVREFPGRLPGNSPRILKV